MTRDPRFERWELDQELADNTTIRPLGSRSLPPDKQRTILVLNQDQHRMVAEHIVELHNGWLESQRRLHALRLPAVLGGRD